MFPYVALEKRLKLCLNGFYQLVTDSSNPLVYQKLRTSLDHDTTYKTFNIYVTLVYKVYEEYFTLYTYSK
jgi:hypothetical protein